VTISPPAPRGEQKIRGLNDTGTKKMWVEKFKSPIVTRTNRVGRIVTRTKRGWTKRQGTVILVGPRVASIGVELSPYELFSGAV
jgi:hypothetical protein